MGLDNDDFRGNYIQPNTENPVGFVTIWAFPYRGYGANLNPMDLHGPPQNYVQPNTENPKRPVGE